jgi:hypothetical protein
MAIKKIKIIEDIPLIEGQTYMTKFQTKEMFTVTKITVDKKGNQHIKGIYEKSPGLGECGISTDRIIHDKKEIGEKEVCDHCGQPVNEKSKGKFINF